MLTGLLVELVECLKNRNFAMLLKVGGVLTPVWSELQAVPTGTIFFFQLHCLSAMEVAPG